MDAGDFVLGFIIFLVILFVGVYYFAKNVWDSLTSTVSSVLNPITSIFKNTYSRGVGQMPSCASGMENDSGLCYTPAQSGYSCAGVVCSKNCDAGFVDTGVDCLKPTIGRGVGTLPICSSGQEEDAGLCYEPTQSGYTCSGVVCTANCPSSAWTDTGLDCTKPSYGNGVGTMPTLSACNAGDTDTGLLCSHCSTVDNGYYSYTWGCGTSLVPCYDGSTGCKSNCYRTWIADLQTSCNTYAKTESCPTGQTLIAGLCYNNCRPGYEFQGGNICAATCPTTGGWTDIGAGCQKPTYTRPAGTIPTGCPSGQENSNGLCYTTCADGYTGNGPICYGNCSSGFTDVGVSCQKPTYTRGVGTTPSACGSGMVLDAGLCYPAPQTGYTCVGALCTENFGDDMQAAPYSATRMFA